MQCKESSVSLLRVLELNSKKLKSMGVHFRTLKLIGSCYRRRFHDSDSNFFNYDWLDLGACSILIYLLRWGFGYSIDLSPRTPPKELKEILLLFSR